MPGLADRFLEAFVDDLLELELTAADPALREDTRRWVVERVRGAGSITRLGLTSAGTLIAAGVLVAARSPYERLPDERRRAIAARLAATGLPVAGEYVKAIRSLAVANVYEHRAA